MKKYRKGFKTKVVNTQNTQKVSSEKPELVSAAELARLGGGGEAFADLTEVQILEIMQLCSSPSEKHSEDRVPQLRFDQQHQYLDQDILELLRKFTPTKSENAWLGSREAEAGRAPKSAQRTPEESSGVSELPSSIKKLLQAEEQAHGKFENNIQNADPSSQERKARNQTNLSN